jgi:NAD(P)-dependent dehydrogenase (short-subunit alcohol dehydrogenase family)
MKNKNYVVIGGTSGIGLSIVKLLSKKNCKIFVGSRNNRNLENLKKASFFKCDVTKNIFEFQEKIDQINGLVYCPGSLILKPFKRINDDDIDNSFKTNVFGLINSIRFFLKYMNKKNSISSMVCFSSVAVTIGMKYHTLVGGTKGAIEGITRSLAAELAPNIRINAISPSITDTPLSKKFISSEKIKNDLINRHPMKKIGNPDDIAEAALYLLSDKSNWVTGQIIHIDGGLSSVSNY